MSIVPAQAKPQVAPPNKRAAYLLGGLTLLTGVFTALGIKTDDLPNVWRNHEILSYVSVTLVLVGAALGAAAGWVLKPGEASERKALLWGNAALGAGLIVGAWAGIATASDRPEPSVTAVATQQGGAAKLEVTVENTNLKSDQDLNLMVEPLYEVTREGGELGYRVGRPLFSASYGPDGDGTVKRSIDVELPAGTFDDVGVRASLDPSIGCYEQRATTGCVIVHMPQRSSWPALDAVWRRRPKGGRSLRVHIAAFDIGGSGLQFLATSRKPRHVIARGKISPTLDADVDRTFGLPVGGARVICLATALGGRRLGCPPHDRNQPGWMILRVPGAR